MSSREQVPDEVWSEIFCLLPRDNLEALSLTSSNFKDISRPLLFAHFKFHPYAFHGRQTDIVLLPSEAEITSSLNRLDFWASDGIARHVRSCQIIPWQAGRSELLFTEATTQSRYILLESFFQRLELFTGLQHFHGDGIHFTQAAVTTLCHALALTKVLLIQCSIADGEHIDPMSLQLGVSSFSFINGVTHDDGIGLWIPLLRPQHLRELHLTCHPRFFGEDLAAIPRFPHVHTLTVTANYSTMSYNLAVLSKFPAVQIFMMRGWGLVQDGAGAPVNASTVLPVIQRYTCGCETMGLFLHRRTLTHLTVQHCNPRDFTEQLRGTNNSITSFDITFDGFDMSVLRGICDFFPMLTELRIRSECEVEEDDGEHINDIATTFFTELEDFTAFQATLQRLAIIWRFEYIDQDESDEAYSHEVEIPKLNELRDVLVERCPGLTTLWLDGDDFLFHWRKSSQGADEEYSTVDEDDAKTRRKTLNDFWAA
ncbi:L-aminoadipate-semialdehyde dehydrogenase [Mycena sanguinolenta]|uniref:L-aminoadipate-semialdehyde dehydrogenase n=1 Tax=Mycena sanguinolenta TaxID=230812 RepID=A0A8H6XJX2_9AGAR|nr:L-aminoadipate-semialdehyde dehydrogenase [Mycena sanguinolenta]